MTTPWGRMVLTDSQSNVFRIALAAALCVAVSACDSAPNENDSSPVVSSVNITSTVTQLDGPGDAVVLSAEPLDAQGNVVSGVSVTWSSSSPSIASVDASGQVLAERYGTAEILALAGTQSGSITIEVVDNLPPSIVDEMFALQHVNVVPMDRDVVLKDQTVLVANGKIEAIGPADQVSIPSIATIITAKEGQEWYVMPGLADMHIHMADRALDGDNDMILYVANGVTTVREMWSNNAGMSMRMKQRAESGGLVPNVYAASPGMDGPGGPWSPDTPAVSSPETARSLVRQYKSEGFDFIKVYNLLSPEVYEAIVDEANAEDIPVIGHVPAAVGLGSALSAGQRTMEHLLGFGQHVSPSGSIYTAPADPSSVDTWAQSVSNAGKWNTPTVTVDVLTGTRKTDIVSSDSYRYLSPNLVTRFANGFHQGISSTRSETALANHQLIISALAQKGAPLLVGTDSGFGYMVPGFSMHDEIQFMADSGIDPYTVLDAATRQAALANDDEDLVGTVETGKQADLLLVFGNPLEDVRRANRRLAVVLRGRFYSQSFLQDLLDGIAVGYGN